MWQLVHISQHSQVPEVFIPPTGTDSPSSRYGSPALPGSLPEQAEGAEHPAGFAPNSARLSKLHIHFDLNRVCPWSKLGACGPYAVPQMFVPSGMFSMQNVFLRNKGRGLSGQNIFTGASGFANI